jgi:uncharacterized surface protein with fasciclin (FAS1) repeats
MPLPRNWQNLWVIERRYTAKDLMDAVENGGGKATLKTVEGEELTVTRRGARLAVRDAKGDEAHITIPDVLQSNGVIHVVNTVLMPG